MVDLAQREGDGPVPLDDLAEEQHIPRRYLAKILQDMRRAGLVRSLRGAGGGYELDVDPRQTTLRDVWEALEGPFRPVECLERPAGCDMVEQCVTRDVWAEMAETLNRVLESVTVAGLAQRHARRVEDGSGGAEKEGA
jgi:Rrf2 family protein